MIKQTQFEFHKTMPRPSYDSTWETASYEALWFKFRTVKRMSDIFRRYDHALPSVVALSEGISEREIIDKSNQLVASSEGVPYSIVLYGEEHYPQGLRDVSYPPELLYFLGDLSLLSSRCIVSVVGTRTPSKAGVEHARAVVAELSAMDVVVMSGLAEGIDSVAHRSALEHNAITVAVIGTSIVTFYPKQNRGLQTEIARRYLVVSQVPICYYASNNWISNRAFFPQRNIVMSALSEATLIVEASDRSGTLYQAKAAIKQKRKLLILNSCFQDGLLWPSDFEKKGAIRILSPKNLHEVLE